MRSLKRGLRRRWRLLTLKDRSQLYHPTRQPSLARFDQDVGQDGYGIAALDDAVDVSERLEQGGSLHGDFHRIIPILERLAKPFAGKRELARQFHISKRNGTARRPVRFEG